MEAVIIKSKVLQSPVVAMLLVTASFLLTACGESTNLNDPDIIVSTKTCADLSGEGVTCVDGRFIDDVVENLNYSCGKVSAVTANDGSFSCPLGSKVEFSLKNPDDLSDAAKSITLGEALVKRTPTTSVNGRIVDEKYRGYVYLTPYDLGSTHAARNNIVRLLQTINQNGAIADELPTRTVRISDADKKKLVSLSASIEAIDFASPDFDAKIKPFLDALPGAPTLISDVEADYFLSKGIYSSVAGSYFVPNYLASVGYSSVAAGDVDGFLGQTAGMRAISASQYLLGATWTLIDRRGRMMGFGVYSTGPNSLPDRCKVLPNISSSTSCNNQQPPRNVLKLKTATRPWVNWPLNADWRLSYDLLAADGLTATGGVLAFTKGRLDRGAVAGELSTYKNIFGEAADSTDDLGRWSLSGSGVNFLETDSVYTMTQYRSVAPTMEPNFWSPLTFPLNIKMNFWAADCDTCLIATMKATILKDGNIVSNLNGKCGHGLDHETLLDADGFQEYPLGVVAQVFTSNGGARTYLSPMIIVPDDPAFGAIRNAQMGTSGRSSGAVSGQLRLRVDASAGAAYLHVYDDKTFVNGNATDTEKSAYWSNQVQFLQGAASSDGSVSSVADTSPGC